MENNLDYYYETLNKQQYAAVFNENKATCLLALPGSGKGHPVNTTKIYTPKGYKLLKDLIEETTVLTPGNGRSKIKKIHDLGERDIFTFTFEDGSTVDVTEDHLWVINSNNKRFKKKYIENKKADYEVLKNKFYKIETSDLIKLFNNSDKRNFFSIPKSSIEFDHSRVPIQPYLYGLLLNKTRVSRSQNAIFFKINNSKIYKKISKSILKNHILNYKKNEECAIFVEQNDKKIIYNKYIEIFAPKVNEEKNTKEVTSINKNFKHNTKKVRMSVLDGIIDSVGHKTTTGTIILTLQNNLLRNDIADLCRSLGFKIEVSKMENKKLIIYNHLDFDDIGYYYKKEDEKLHSLNITSIIKKEKKEKAACIELYDAPHLYYTNNFIITHNTHTLIGKIIKLIEDDNDIEPKDITAITFTNKAAKEIRERASKIIGADGELVNIGTFHSICLKILIKYGSKINLNKFTIMDDKDATKKIDRIKDEVFITKKTVDTKLIKTEISNYKKKLMNPKKALLQAETNFEKKVIEIYRKYRLECADENNLDFDDLIFYTILLLKRFPDVKKQIRKSIKFLLVDEAQDSNKIQFILVKFLLSDSAKLFMVADDDQSIYGFRGAQPEYVVNFNKIFEGGKILKLEQNYRSTKNIIKAADNVISNNKNRQEKHGFTDNETGSKVILKLTRNPNYEAKFISDEILNLVHNHGYDYKDFAILYRLNSQSRKVEDSLIANGIPYNVIGSTGFYDRAEIKDLMAYLKLLVNPDDKISFERVLSIQKGIGNKTKEKIIEYGKKFKYNYSDAILFYDGTSKTINQLGGLRSLIREKDKIKNPLSILKLIITDGGYGKYLKNKYKDNYDDRMENIKELLLMAKEYQDEIDNNDYSLSEFTHELVLRSGKGEIPDTTKLLTVHSAKGLEFKIVFIISVEEKMIPYQLALKEGNVAEERRLFYVAMTRAEKKLYLIYNEERTSWDNKIHYPTRSRFINEISEKYLVYYEELNKFKHNLEVKEIITNDDKFDVNDFISSQEEEFEY